jgi:ATP-dependent Clp protease adaptor protein ClpS
MFGWRSCRVDSRRAGALTFRRPWNSARNEASGFAGRAVNSGEKAPVSFQIGLRSAYQWLSEPLASGPGTVPKWVKIADLAGKRSGLYDDLNTYRGIRGSSYGTPMTNSPSFFGLSVAPPARLAGDDRKRNGEGNAPGTAVITKTKPKTKRPNLYRVLILNDDYTPMEFVVHVLERFFSRDHEAATRIMLHVHHHGIGECGIYTYEVAETKVTQVMDFARKHQHPLQCVMEKK